MRLAVISSSYPAHPGDSTNAGVFVRDFAVALGERGHGVDVITPQRAVAGDDPVRVRPFWWPGRATSLTHLSSRSALNVLRFALLLLSGVVVTLRTVRRRRTDHVVAMWALPSGLIALAARRLRGVPYSVWALGSDVWRASDYPMGRALLRRVLRGAEHVYADGVGLAREVEDISGRECDFLPSSRRLPEPEPTAEGPGRLDGRPERLLCVARHHPHKGVDVLVEAMGSLPPEARGRLHLTIYGEGPDTPRLRERVEALGLASAVRFGGVVGARELARELRDASCTVIPSRVESIPVILSDAAQAGCPVVVSDVGDMGDLVGRFRAGRVVAPDAPEELSAALAAVAAGELRRDERGLRDLAALLDVRTSAERFLALARGEPDPDPSGGQRPERSASAPLPGTDPR